MSKPLAIDLFAGLGGWSDGLLAEGFDVIGLDIERHVYGDHRYPAQLVIQDVLTLHGSQFRDAALIVASPPCQAYSLDGISSNNAESFFSRLRRGENGHFHHISGPYLLRYAQESAWREDSRRVSNGDQTRNAVALALSSKPSVDFCGYWQRHIKA